jgi:hypothetical protein
LQHEFRRLHSGHRPSGISVCGVLRGMDEYLYLDAANALGTS